MDKEKLILDFVDEINSVISEAEQFGISPQEIISSLINSFPGAGIALYQGFSNP